MGNVQSELKSKLLSEGAALIGFADISELPADVRFSMNNAISIAVALDASIINEISEGPTLRYHGEYKRVNNFLGELCRFTADFLQNHGHKAVQIEPTVKKLDYSSLSTPLPHKTVATRAGLGWIGKSALLITKEYGAAIRLATVLSDAAFETGTPVNSSGCGDCNVCVECCPTNAMTGSNWKAGMEQSGIYDAAACCSMAKELSAKIGVSATICGICINVCPWTQKYLKRRNQ